MTQPVSHERLRTAYETARAALLAERNAAGHWTGELSSSALSTAVAVSALALVRRHTAGTSPAARHDDLIADGISWLVAHQNADGGWGDTVKSFSNTSTSMLVRAAFHLTDTAEQHREPLRKLDAYLHEHCGKSPAEQAAAIRARYGKDRTFAVPILTTCALAGLVDWKEVTPLPFELACLPQSWFRFLRLPIVSYALPALIAIGQAVYHHRPLWNPLTRGIRALCRKRSLRVLEAIQPSSGGYLEATPLTSFVTLSLAACGLADHAVARNGVRFLINSVRPDGSWPIDTNLATWVTTLSVNALAAAGDLDKLDRREELLEWLLRQQFKERHPFTGADPGGWAWTDLPGGVPDADDTAGALIAISKLSRQNMPFSWENCSAIREGLRWLANLRNQDGGWPTFCRGWLNLPFDRSGADITAHAVRAFQECGRLTNSGLFADAIFHLPSSGLAYLDRVQRPDGSWLPLWFGNQYAPDDANPTYGTARVLAAYRDLAIMDSEPARRGVAWLLHNQNSDGGWGGLKGTPPSVEETALAVEVLLDAEPQAAVEAAVNNGLTWLVQQVESGGLQHPSPIGFYFAKLWYFERLYPIIFSVAALGRAVRKRNAAPTTV